MIISIESADLARSQRVARLLGEYVQEHTEIIDVDDSAWGALLGMVGLHALHVQELARPERIMIVAPGLLSTYAAFKRHATHDLDPRLGLVAVGILASPCEPPAAYVLLDEVATQFGIDGETTAVLDCRHLDDAHAVAYVAGLMHERDS
jgi:hypothetical protein